MSGPFRSTAGASPIRSPLACPPPGRTQAAKHDDRICMRSKKCMPKHKLPLGDKHIQSPVWISNYICSIAFSTQHTHQSHRSSLTLSSKSLTAFECHAPALFALLAAMYEQSSSLSAVSSPQTWSLHQERVHTSGFRTEPNRMRASQHTRKK